MLIDSIRQTIICDELQLGQALNQSVEQGAQAQFNLLMSLLSDDVRDQPQFDMTPKEADQAAIDYRHRFQLTPPDPLYMTKTSSEALERWNKAASFGDLVNHRLEQSLLSEGLTPKVAEMDTQILNNISLLSRLKYQAIHDVIEEPAQNNKADPVEESAMYHVLNDFDYEKPLSVQFYS